MRILLAAVGKMKPSPEWDLLEKYRRQLAWPLVIKEIDIKKTMPVEQRKAAEADELLSACHDCDVLMALDERGQTLTSEALAESIAGWQNQGFSKLGIVIGGQDGLDERVRRHARLTLAFGQMTWPHMLVRAMLAEQLYRAHTILSGHPYHRS